MVTWPWTNKAASSTHTDGSSCIRQLAPMWTPSSTQQSASAPYRCCPLLSRFEYIDRRTCPGVSRAGHSPLKIAPSSVGIWTPSDSDSLGQPEPKRHFDRFSRSCRAHDRQTDHAISSVTTGRIYVVLRCGLIITRHTANTSTRWHFALGAMLSCNETRAPVVNPPIVHN